MFLWSNINGKLYPPTTAGAQLDRKRIRRGLAAFLLAPVLLVACGATAWAQQPDSQPVRETVEETVAATHTTDPAADQPDVELPGDGVEKSEVSVVDPLLTDRLPALPNPTPAPSPSPQTKSAPAQPKKEKRGSLIIAPIPISSPAVGSGLILGLGY